ncbi:hypothetical protein ACFX13_019472 [Malus domestica]
MAKARNLKASPSTTNPTRVAQLFFFEVFWSRNDEEVDDPFRSASALPSLPHPRSRSEIIGQCGGCFRQARRSTEGGREDRRCSQWAIHRL